MSPVERKARAESIARAFSKLVSKTVEAAIDNLNNLLNETNDEYQVAEIRRKIAEYEHPYKGRAAVINENGINNFFEVIKETNFARWLTLDHAKWVRAEALALKKSKYSKINIDNETLNKEAEELTAKKEAAYKKIIDNWEVLVDDACVLLENREHASITREAISTDINSDIKDIENFNEEQDDNPEADLKDGISILKFRQMDPRTSLTREVREILGSIPMKGAYGKFITDDLGNRKYLDENYVYITILDYMSQIYNSDDFIDAMKSMIAKYPWMRAIVNKIEKNKDLEAKFYKAFRLDFIPSKIMKYGKFVNLNKMSLVESNWNKVIRNYESGTVVDKTDSIYDEAGIPVRSKEALGKELINSTRQLIRADLANNKNNIVKNIVKLGAMLGLEVNPLTIEGMIDSSIEYDNLKEDSIKANIPFNEIDMSLKDIDNALSSMTAIFNNLKEGKISNNDHLINYNNTLYKKIISNLFTMTEEENEASYRQGDKAYYSYSAPNMLGNLFKILKNSNPIRNIKTTLSYIDKKYGYSDWFKDPITGEWNNEILKLVSIDEDFRDGLDHSVLLQYTSPSTGETKDYTDWTNEDVTRMQLEIYYAGGSSSKHDWAWYNFPIFADSPVGEIFKFIRYKSKKGSTYKEQMNPLIAKVIKQEIERIIKVEAREKLRIKGENIQPITNYDTTLVTNNKGKLVREEGSNGGAEFKFYPVLNNYMVTNSKGVKIDFINHVKNLIKTKDTIEYEQAINDAVQYAMNSNFKEWFNSNENTISEGILNQIAKEDEDTYDSTNIDKYTSRVTEMAEEFYWNYSYSQTQIIELLTGDLAFYKDAVDFQKRFKEVYAAGLKPYTNSKHGKKTETMIILKDNIITSSNYTNIADIINTHIDTSTKVGRMTRDDILNKFKNINVADAQAMRSISSMREIFDMLALWTPEMEQAFNNFTNNTWSAQDFYVIWNTIKPFMYTSKRVKSGISESSDIWTPMQNKNSEFLLMAMHSLVAGPINKSGKLLGLNKFMEDKHIALTQFESAVKVGGQGAIDLNFSRKALNNAIDKNNNITIGTETIKINPKISLIDNFYKVKNDADKLLSSEKITQEQYNDFFNSLELGEQETYEILQEATEITDTNPSGNSEVVHQLDYEDYVVQQPTDDHLLDHTALIGSQFKKLITSDTPTDGVKRFTLTIGGVTKKFSGPEIKDLFRSVLTENLIDSYFQNVAPQFQDIEKFAKFLQNTVKGNSKYGRDVRDAIRLINIIDPITGKPKKVFNIPLYDKTIAYKIEEIILSKFKNEVTKQRIKGGNAILVSNFGLTKELNIVYNKEGDKASGVKYVECYLPAYASEFFKLYMDKGTHVLNYDKLAKEHPELLEVVGYRIPTEDKYSMVPLHIKGFLPRQNGASIMLPADITQISGSDFDVDKLFLMLKTFKMEYYDKSDEYLLKKYKEFITISKAASSLTDKNYKVPTIDEYLRQLPKEERSRYRLDTPKIVTDTYDLNKLPEENTRDARNNLLISISTAILTSPYVAEAFNNPGNFDPIKRSGRIASIISNSLLGEFAIDKEFGLGMSFNNPLEFFNNIDKITKALTESSLKTLKNFTNKYQKFIDPLAPSTYSNFHTQNMVGGKSIGIYALSTSAQALLQGEKFGSKGDLMINGKHIKDLTMSYNENNERISKLSAYWSAASVDNAKDPQLAALYQNSTTIDITNYLTRAGVDSTEIGILFMQPLTKDLFKNPPKHLEKYLEGNINEYLQVADNKGYDLIIPEDRLLKEFNPTNSQMIKNSWYHSLENPISFMMEAGMSEIEAIKLDKEMSQFNLNMGLYMLEILKESKALSDMVQNSRYDATNGAIKPSVHSAILQTRKLEVYNLKASQEDFPLYNANIIETGISKVTNNDDDVKNKLRQSKLSFVQASYTLGIEGAERVASPYLIQYSPVHRFINRFVLNNTDTGYITEENEKALFNDLFTFYLSNTKLFGDDEKNSYETKRDYYLFEYPKIFAKLRTKNKTLANYSFISRLKIDFSNGAFRTIKFNKAGIKGNNMRDSLMGDLDAMLYSEDPIIRKTAIDLFKYSYYKDGLDFKPEGFASYFSPTFKMSITEFIDAEVNFENFLKEELQKINSTIASGTKLDSLSFSSNFLKQYYRNNITAAPRRRTKKVIKSNYTLPTKMVSSIFSKGNPYPYICVENMLEGQEVKIYLMEFSNSFIGNDGTEFSTYKVTNIITEQGIKGYNMKTEATEMNTINIPKLEDAPSWVAPSVNLAPTGRNQYNTGEYDDASYEAAMTQNIEGSSFDEVISLTNKVSQQTISEDAATSIDALESALNQGFPGDESDLFKYDFDIIDNIVDKLLQESTVPEVPVDIDVILDKDGNSSCIKK